MTRLARVGVFGGLLVLAPAVAALLLSWNGALEPPRLADIPDPGALTRWGLPVARAIRDVAAAVTIGILVLVATTVPPEPDTKPGRLGRTQAWLLSVAAVIGGVWVWAGFAAMLFTFSDLAGTGLRIGEILASFGYFVTDFDLGRSLLINVLLGALVAAGALVARRITSLGVLALVALGSLWPLALTGHVAGALNHDMAVNAQAAHLLGICVWLGGLAGLALARRRLGTAFGTVAVRFSALAAFSFILIAASGVVSAMLRLGSWANLASDYGTLLIMKVAALSLLGAVGWYQRRRSLPALNSLSRASRAFRSVAIGELALMAIAVGVAVALGRTQPPGEDTRLTTAESLLGYAMPPPLGAAQWFTQWRIDTLWTPLALLGVAGYLIGVKRLRRRGDRWPLGRVAAWLGGSVLLIWATSGAPGVYGDVLFSMHMVQHMTIATAVPTLLVLGAPVTIAMRALRPRKDGSRGAREWLLATVHSKLLRVLGHPLVAAGLFIVGLVAFYYSALFGLSMRSHTGHQLMIAHFLASGYLFASVICGVDPGVKRPVYPLRMLLLMITFSFHALFSISLMSSTTVLAEDWYSTLGRTWGNSLEQDQYIGASLGWALGDYPLAILALGLVWMWAKSDYRDARRYDRRATRDGDKALSTYNDYLQRLSDSDDQRARSESSSTLRCRQKG